MTRAKRSVRLSPQITPPRVPNGDREDSLGLSTAMPQVTSRTHQGTLKGRERT